MSLAPSQSTPALDCGGVSCVPSYLPFFDLRLLLPTILGWGTAWIITGEYESSQTPVQVVLYVLCAITAGTLLLLFKRTHTNARHARYPAGSLTAALAAALLISAATATSSALACQLYRLDQQQLTGQPYDTFTGRVVKPSAHYGRYFATQIKVSGTYSQAATVQVRSSTPLPVIWGQCVKAKGALHPGGNPPRLGYLRSGQLIAQPDSQCGPSTLTTLVSEFRQRWNEALQPHSASSRGVLAGMSVGDTSALPLAQREALRTASLSHLTAISGAHLAVVASASHLLLPGRSRTKSIILAALMITVALLSGASASALRAMSMGIVMIVSFQSGRRSRAEAALAAIVIGWLIVDPWLARDWGFALSCTATAAVLLTLQNQAPLKSQPWWVRGWQKVRAVVAVALTAQIATAPLIMLMTGSFPLWAVIANVLVTPMVAVTTLSAMGAAFAAQFSFSAAQGLILIGSWTGQIILNTATWVSELPYALVPAQVGWKLLAIAVVSGFVARFTPLRQLRFEVRQRKG